MRCALLCLLALAAPALAQEKPKKPPTIYPLAVLAFEERGAGAKELGPKVADLVFARLVTKPDLYLVDRSELKKVLEEQHLNASGAVAADDATKLGRLTGAKVLVTGSVVHADKKLVLVAKIVGTETTRVLGASAEGKPGDDLGSLAEKLADAVAEVVLAQADKLAPRPASPADRAAALAKKLGKSVRPAVTVRIPERHIGAPTVDPAAQTEFTRFLVETGFDTIDPDAPGKAGILVTGEAFSETQGRVGPLVSVKARVEIKAVDRKTGKVLASDAQTAVVVDAAEQSAGKQALQEAAAALAERVLPKLVKKDK